MRVRIQLPVCLVFLSFCSPLAAQIDCAKLIYDAESNYMLGFFEDAARLLDQCLAGDSLMPDHRVKAYRILIYIYMAQKKQPSAEKQFAVLLDIMPEYEPDPIEDMPSYIALFHQVSERNTIKSPQE